MTFDSFCICVRIGRTASSHEGTTGARPMQPIVILGGLLTSSEPSTPISPDATWPNGSNPILRQHSNLSFLQRHFFHFVKYRPVNLIRGPWRSHCLFKTIQRTDTITSFSFLMSSTGIIPIGVVNSNILRGQSES